MAQEEVGFRTIGYIGFINLTILLLITIYKFFYFLSQQISYQPLIIRKKIIFYLLLIFSILVDIPMYITFIIYNKYILFTYSFHKLQSTLLLSAYSMTIYDWSNVLYDIHEIQFKPYILNKTLLIIINIIFILISLSNFIYCNVVTNIDSFTRSPIYITMIFLQISVELFLICLMLFSGIQLSRRIYGVTGILRNIITTSSTPGVTATSTQEYPFIGSSSNSRTTTTPHPTPTSTPIGSCGSSHLRRIYYSIISFISNVILFFVVIFQSFHFRHHTTTPAAAPLNSSTSGGGRDKPSTSPAGIPTTTASSSSTSYRSEQEGIYSGFETALNRLISVMAICAFCLLVQVCCIPLSALPLLILLLCSLSYSAFPGPSLLQLTLLLLNYVLGYQSNANKSVGPELFYWYPAPPPSH
jgi:hypothetical protein